MQESNRQDEYCCQKPCDESELKEPSDDRPPEPKPKPINPVAIAFIVIGAIAAVIFLVFIVRLAVTRCRSNQIDKRIDDFARRLSKLSPPNTPPGENRAGAQQDQDNAIRLQPQRRMPCLGRR